MLLIFRKTQKLGGKHFPKSITISISRPVWGENSGNKHRFYTYKNQGGEARFQQKEEGSNKGYSINKGQDEELYNDNFPEGSRDMVISEDSIDSKSDNGTGDDIAQNNSNNREGEGIDYNIMHVSEAGDLSPKQTNSLKEKKERATIPLQVRIRHYNGGTTSCNQ